MSDIRKWRFTAGHGTTSILKNDATDMWGEWKADGKPAILSYVIHAQYDLAKNLTTDRDALLMRSAIEKRMKAMMKYQGREGILDIDYDLGGTRPESLSNVTLESIAPVQVDNNLILEYDLTFTYATPGLLTRNWSATLMDQADSSTNKGDWDPAVIYHQNDTVFYNGVLYKALQDNLNQPPAQNAIWALSGTALTGINNCYFVVDIDQADNTIFKPITRGKTIRIRAVPGMQTVTLTGIRQYVSAADNELSRRQASELVMQTWIARKGTERRLVIDGAVFGVCHLQEVKKGSIDLPDAVTFDLVFLKGYING